MKRFGPFHLILVGVILIAFYALYTGYQNWTTLNTLQEAAPGHKLQASQEQADLQVVMIYDYSCPFCYQMDPPLRQAVETDGEVELIYKFITDLGPRSERMARAAYAAGEQGKFLDVHNYFAARTSLEFTEDQLVDMATELDLDVDQFNESRLSDEALDVIDENYELARKLGVRSTPTFLIGSIFFIPRDMPTEQTFLDLFVDARQKQQ